MALTIFDKPKPKYVTKGYNKAGNCVNYWPGQLSLGEVSELQSIASRQAHGDIVKILQVEVKEKRR